jgi:DNA-binding MarR family transcriptional regulator
MDKRNETRNTGQATRQPGKAAGGRKAALPSGVNPGELLLLDNQLCFALYSASLTMTKVYKPLLADLGVTYPQYLVMLVLWERDELTVSEVGERLFLDSGTLTPLLKRLEALELIVRRRSAQDERQVIVSLTPEGRKLRQRALAVPAELLCAAQCTVEEISGLTRRVQKLRGALAESVEAAALAES